MPTLKATREEGIGGAGAGETAGRLTDDRKGREEVRAGRKEADPSEGAGIETPEPTGPGVRGTESDRDPLASWLLFRKLK